MIRSRLFLVGCPRSGTTLLQSMLASHSVITSFPESHFLLVTSRSRRGRWMRKLGLVSPEMRGRLRQFLNDVGQPKLMPQGAFLLQPFIRTFASILDQLAQTEAKSVWLEKTPGHLYYINDFEQAIPDAKFIHLVRNGADAVASLYEVTNQYPERWGHGYTIDACVATWNRSVELSREHCVKANHLWVCYEQLVNDPAHVLEQICAFIGVTFEGRMVEEHSQSAGTLVLPHEEWKQRAYRAVDAKPSQKFRQLFTAAQQAEIVNNLRKV